MVEQVRMRKVCLDLGHWGKRRRPLDRGAVYRDKVEAYEVVPIMLECAKALEREGYLAYLLTYGEYEERNKFANEIDADLYLAFHLNSAERPGKYGLILYDKRGCFSGFFAEVLKDEFERILPWKFKVKGIDKGDRGFVQIKFTEMPALILEPYFLNSEDQAKYFDKEDFAIALVAGVNKSFRELGV